MKVSPTNALSRLGIRLGERRQRSSGGETPALTQDDEDNISRMTGVIERMLILLDQERDALLAADAAQVSSFFNQKQELMKQFELLQPVVEPLLREKVPQTEPLRDLLRNFAQSLSENGRLLEGMAQASRAINSELERIKAKTSLRGMYNKRGQLRDGVDRSPQKISKNF